jgi:hypothetical protein
MVETVARVQPEQTAVHDTETISNHSIFWYYDMKNGITVFRPMMCW